MDLQHSTKASLKKLNKSFKINLMVQKSKYNWAQDFNWLYTKHNIDISHQNSIKLNKSKNYVRNNSHDKKQVNPSLRGYPSQIHGNYLSVVI